MANLAQGQTGGPELELRASLRRVKLIGTTWTSKSNERPTQRIRQARHPRWASYPVLAGGWGLDPARRREFSRRDLLGIAVMVASGVVSVLDAHGTTRKLVVGILMLGAEIGLLLARRVLPPRWGVAGVALTVGAGIAVTLLVPPGLGPVAVLAGASVVPSHLPPGPIRSAGVGAVAVAFGVSIVVISGSLSGLLAGVGSWFLSERSVEQVALQAERDRAVALLAELEASRQAQVEGAAAEERNRIAREMHDVLAHSLAGLSMQLQAIRAVARREGVPASVTGPLDRAAELARDGVQEARAAVGALRAPRRWGVEDLPALLEAFPGEATLTVHGGAGQLDPDAGHAVYRAVQEALTNAARYATGSTIHVDMTWTEDGLRVRVRDHGLPPGHQPSGIHGSGTGLDSMRSRIEAAGGTLAAGPEPDGTGWTVDVQVPVLAGSAGGRAAPTDGKATG